MSETSQSFSDKSTWKRAAYMLLFAILYQVSEIVIFVIVLVQFLLTVITGNRNDQLSRLSIQLGKYVRQIVDFLSYNSEEKPYPFSDWPSHNRD